MTTYTTPTTATDEKARRLSMGFGRAGELVLSQGKTYRIVSARRTKYHVVDENGREWLVNKSGVSPAPEGATFAGPEKTKDEAAAEKIKPGRVVRFTGKHAAKHDGKWLVIKRTSATRVKLMKIGSGGELTSPVGILELVED